MFFLYPIDNRIKLDNFLNNFVGFGLVVGPGSLLRISWHATQWIPILNASNILDYFSERSNPFYDKTCNNEIIKMQRLNPSHLK